MTETGQNISIYQGDYRKLVIPIYQEDEITLQPLTDVAYVTWVVYKPTPGTIYLTKNLASGIALDPTGIITITINTIDTLNLLGNYSHECEIVDTNFHRITVLTGYFNVIKSKANYV